MSLETGPSPEPHPMDPAFDATGKNRYKELDKRTELGPATVEPLVMVTTGEYLRAKNIPHMYLTHPEVEDKPAYLESVAAEIAQGLGTEVPARMLKTVTLKFTAGDNVHRVLVGSMGRRIDNGVKRQIAADLQKSFGYEITPKQAKGAAINPPDGWDPAEELELEAGVVGPLLNYGVHEAVDGYYFLDENIEPEDPPVPVEIALSPEDSLVAVYSDELKIMLAKEQAAFVQDPNFFRIIEEPKDESASGNSTDEVPSNF